MDIDVITAPLVAVVGVVGTLMSALLTQRAADRSQQREQEREDGARNRRIEARELWACYVALNISGRHYLAALTDQLYALGHDAELPNVRQRLTDVRDDHREAYAEAQLILPDRVLDHAEAVSHGLGAVYGMVRRLDDGTPETGDSPSAAHEEIRALWDRLREMRRQMRADLAASRSECGRWRGEAEESEVSPASDRHSEE
ncbi:hypothetical protein ACIQM0_37075 [Streptomyces sp. NPDC091387]|uniref:hypothetical protein n=1 Tax=Streptomyces sp. NPDC091387 TaxID=3365998 RepID=UPI0037FB6AAE